MTDAERTEIAGLLAMAGALLDQAAQSSQMRVGALARSATMIPSLVWHDARAAARAAKLLRQAHKLMQEKAQ